jgi:hypothetical protein
MPENKREDKQVRILKLRLSVLLFAPCLLSGALHGQSAGTSLGSEAGTCRDLTLSMQESGSISSAEFEQPPFTIGSGTEAITVTEAFCRVSGIVKPSEGSEIRFEVWLPPVTNWNGKLAGVGSGGSFGIIEYSSLSRALSRKYATVATDNVTAVKIAMMSVGAETAGENHRFRLSR